MFEHESRRRPFAHLRKRARTLDEARFVNLQRRFGAGKTRFHAALHWSANERLHTVKTPAKIFLWDSKKMRKSASRDALQSLKTRFAPFAD
jgi:hypothetical protein